MNSHTFNDLTGNLEQVEKIIDYTFSNNALLFEALTHSSYANEKRADTVSALASSREKLDRKHDHNERLEFLGDAVIGLIVAQCLMKRFPTANEGKLSRWRSALVSRKMLAELAVELGFGRALFLGRGEQRTRGAEKRSILAGVFESVVGAFYLDAGLLPVEAFLERVFSPWFSNIAQDSHAIEKMMDKKTHLQERTQSLYKKVPIYRVLESWGQEHAKFFKVEIVIDDKVIAVGNGKSKKEAEQDAAHLALLAMGEA